MPRSPAAARAGDVGLGVVDEDARAGRHTDRVHTRLEKARLRFHLADLVREDEMIEGRQSFGELTAIMGRVQHIGVRAQKQRVPVALQTCDESSDRLIEPEDFRPNTLELLE